MGLLRHRGVAASNAPEERGQHLDEGRALLLRSLMAAVPVHQKMGREPVNWQLSETLYGMSFKRAKIAVAQSVSVGVVTCRIYMVKHE